MERYNISFPDLRQPLPVIETPARSVDGRWPDPLPPRRPSATAAAAAILLHVAAVALVLAWVRLPAFLTPADQQTIALVFAPTQDVSPATPDPPPAESPEPPAPLAESTAPVPPPVAEPEPLKAPPPPVPRTPVTHPTPTPRARPVAPSHKAAAPPSNEPHPSDDTPRQPPTRPAEPEAAVDTEWQSSLAAWLAAHRSYPQEARRQGTQGSVVLRFTADRSGRVLDVMLVSGSGSPILDAAAESVLRNAILPPFTSRMERDTITVTVRLRYTLTN